MNSRWPWQNTSKGRLGVASKKGVSFREIVRSVFIKKMSRHLLKCRPCKRGGGVGVPATVRRNKRFLVAPLLLLLACTHHAVIATTFSALAGLISQYRAASFGFTTSR
jgi:hypothetical protein